MNLKTRLLFCALGMLPMFATFGMAIGRGVELRPNEPVAIDFSKTDRAEFIVTATAGEFVEINCRRRDADTALAISLPDGSLTASNSPFSFSINDRLVYVGEKSAEFRLVVGPRRPGYRNGGCILLRSAPRPATEKERVAAQAVKLAGDARLTLVGADARLAKAGRALGLINSALTLADDSGDDRVRADVLFQKAQIMGQEFGRKRDAIVLYEVALKIYESLGDDAGRAAALRFLGDETRDLDSETEPRPVIVARAEDYFSRAAELDRKLGDKLGEAATLTYRCRLFNDNGRFQEGFEDCREALRLGAQQEPAIGYRTYMNLASLASNSGDRETCLLNNRVALEKLALVRDYVSPAREAFIKTNLGWLFMDTGNYADAVSNLRVALAITEAIERHGQTARILVALSHISQRTGKPVDALKYAERAVEIYRRYDPGKIQAALNALGTVRQSLGELAAARELFTEAVTVNQRNGDRYAEADSLYNLAQLEAADAHIEVALEKVRIAIDRSEIIRATLYGQRQRTSYLSILRKFYELEANLLWRLHDDRRDPALVEKAWQANEKLRARALLENLIESGLDPNAAAPAGFYQKQRESLEAIAAAEFKRASRPTDLTTVSAAETDLLRSISNYDELREQSRRTNPRFSALNDPPAMTSDAARALIDDETIVLEFALGENRSGVWVFSRDQFKFVPLTSRTQVELAARSYYDALIDPKSKPRHVENLALALSRLVIFPVMPELTGHRRIVIIADGLLQTVPFAALLTTQERDAKPLAADFEIATAPSFASLASMRENRERRPAAHEKMIAVFADPIFQRDDERLENAPKISDGPAEKQIHSAVDAARREIGMARLGRLPFSAFEASKIASFATDRTFVATGVRASRENFLRGDFGSYRILHFATHGFINEDHPELSGLVLSLYDEDRRAQNGFLRAIDLYSMKLNNDLVVLSACQTALGRDVTGEGIVGLSRSFLYAGAKSVVSSLWKIDDAASAEFMSRFYGAMLIDGKSPTEALRTAQNGMRQIPRYKDPRFWAGFTLNGDWR